MLQVDERASEVLAEQVGARTRQCFRNAAIGAMTVPDAWYVEGWAVIPIAGGIVVEHAWVVVGDPDDDDSRILDPTYALLPDLGAVIYVRTKAYNRCWIEQNAFGRTLPFVSFRDERHREAYEEAWSLTGLNLESLRYPSRSGE